MQFLIDTDTESTAGLFIAAQVIEIYAQARASAEETEAAAGRPAIRPLQTPAAPPIGKPAATPPPPAPLPPGNVPPPPVSHPEVHPDAKPKDVPAGTPEVDPAAAFARPLVPAPPAAVVVVASPATVALVTMVPPPPAATVADVPVASTAAVLAAENTTANQQTSATAEAPASAADSAGIPWDERIHSETRKTNADGTWRFRRNLDVNVKNTVMAELKSRATGMPVSLPAVPTTAHVAAPGIVPPPPAAVPPPPVTPQPPVNDVAPPAPVQLPLQSDVGLPVAPIAGPVSTAPVTSFRDLMTKVNVALAAGRLTQPQLAEACKASGVDSVSALAAQPMHVPTVDAYLNRWLAA